MNYNITHSQPMNTPQGRGIYHWILLNMTSTRIIEDLTKDIHASDGCIYRVHHLNEAGHPIMEFLAAPECAITGEFFIKDWAKKNNFNYFTGPHYRIVGFTHEERD